MPFNLPNTNLTLKIFALKMKSKATRHAKISELRKLGWRPEKFPKSLCREPIPPYHEFVFKLLKMFSSAINESQNIN